jgi:hypothetical protein
MSRVRFFLKLAFICNLCFLAGEASYYIKYADSFEGLVKYILVLGFLVAFPLNIIVCLITTILLIRHKVAWVELPPFVFVVNIIILVAQLLFLI